MADSLLTVDERMMLNHGGTQGRGLVENGCVQVSSVEGRFGLREGRIEQGKIANSRRRRASRVDPIQALRADWVLGMRGEAIDLLQTLNSGHAATTARLWSMSCSTSEVKTALATSMPMSCSSIAHAPDLTRPQCSRAINTQVSIVPVLRQRQDHCCGGCLHWIQSKVSAAV